MEKGKVKFIRKNGRVIPIKSDGKNSNNKKDIKNTKRKLTLSKKHKSHMENKAISKGANVGAIAGVALAGLSGKSFTKTGLAGLAIGGALGFIKHQGSYQSKSDKKSVKKHSKRLKQLQEGSSV